MAMGEFEVVRPGHIRLDGDPMINVYQVGVFMRHGAYDPYPESMPLNDIGREQIRESAGGVQAQLSAVGVPKGTVVPVFHSPALRAAESAVELEAAVERFSLELHMREELDCESFGMYQFAKALDTPFYVVVSHQPDLEVFAQKVGSRHSPRKAEFRTYRRLLDSNND